MNIKKEACWVAAITLITLVIATLVFDIGNTMIFIFIAAQLAGLNVFIGSIARHLEEEKKNE